MANSNLATLLGQIERQYRPKWQYAAPAELASRIHAAGANAETALTVLSRALIGQQITFAEWDSATQEALKRLGLLALVIGIGGLLLKAAFRQTPEDAFKALEDNFNKRVTALADGLGSGRVSIDDWQAAMREEISIYHLGAGMVGSGKDKTFIPLAQDNARKQAAFLDAWADEIRSGKFPIDAAARLRQRARMYAGAGEATFSHAQQHAMGIPRLPAYPKDGKTDCRFNCYCKWQIIPIAGDGNFDCYWVFDPTKENCRQCPRRSLEWSPLKVRGGVVQPYNPAGLFAKGAVANV